MEERKKRQKKSRSAEVWLEALSFETLILNTQGETHSNRDSQGHRTHTHTHTEEGKGKKMEVKKN